MDIVIFVEGGVVQSVVVTEEFKGRVMIVDRDEEDERHPYYSEKMEGNVFPYEVDVDPHVVSKVIKEWEVV